MTEARSSARLWNEKLKALPSHKALLIEDDVGDADLIKEIMSGTEGHCFDVEWVDRLSAGLGRLSHSVIDVVLLDLNLPDSSGLDTFFSVHSQFPTVPIVVLTGLNDEEAAIKAVGNGAQDYLVKGEVEGDLLVRALRYAIERNRTEQLLRKSEERYRLLVEMAPEVIFSISASGVITSVNRAFDNVTGLSRDEWVGKEFTEFVRVEDRELARERMSQALQEMTGFIIEGSLPSKSEESSVEEIIGTVLSEYGKPVELICFARDITERKRIERMKGDFVSCASHQLKTPVGMIRGYMDILLSGLAGELTTKQRIWLEKVQEINSKNYRLICDLLNVSRLDRGVVSVELKTVSLKKIVDLSLSDYRELMVNKGLALSLELQDEEVVVVADMDKMVEALSNVIHNAIKFTDNGGITIRLRRDTPFGIVEIADTGKGMTPELLTKLFTRDQILSGGPTPEYSCGLGLYIAREFMRLQGGDVFATSGGGRGSNFTFEIPLAGGDSQ